MQPPLFMHLSGVTNEGLPGTGARIQRTHIDPVTHRTHGAEVSLVGDYSKQERTQKTPKGHFVNNRPFFHCHLTFMLGTPSDSSPYRLQVIVA